MLPVLTDKTSTKQKILKELAAFKKESFASIKARYKKMDLGYIVKNKNVLELYYLPEGEVRKRGKACVIVRR